jgi:aminopeptidase N
MRSARFLVFTISLMCITACNLVRGEELAATPPASVLDPFEIEWNDRSFQEQAWLVNSYDPAIDLSTATEYRMEISIPDDFDIVSGRQRIRYFNNESQALEDLYLRLFPNLSGGEAQVRSVTIDGHFVEPIYESQDSAVRIPLTPALDPGDSLILELEFSTSIPRQMEGNYGLFGYFQGYLVLDTFYPMIPVFDENGWQRDVTPPNGDPTYNDISFYIVQVHAPSGLSVITTGSETDRREEDGEQTITFASGPARDFYIAASEGLEMIEEQIGETAVRSYAPSQFREHAELVLRTGVNALRTYERRFGEYPYPEMELISTPMQALGIEYPGLMAINLSLFDPEADIGGVPSAIYLESTVAHEVAHQWFYNVVGNDQVKQPWLDEAFAQYATYLYYLDIYGEGAASSYQRSWYDRWDRTDRADIPIGMPAGEYQGAEYGSIVYGRGPIFVQELSTVMRIQTFDTFLLEYVQEHAWGIGTEESFQQSAEAACDCQLDELFSRWVGEDT